jgi:hypothetical protein
VNTEALLEYDARRRLRWQRHGSEWVLVCGRRRMGRVVPDEHVVGMYRIALSAGRLSAPASLSWTKDAALAAAIRELVWEAREASANDPRNCPENRGSLAA